MTVCVAAITNGNRVVGVSDRMLSTSEIAFEPITPKVHWATSAIYLMMSGDAALQSEIRAALQADLDRHIGEPNAEWLTVKEVADLYLLHWNDVKRRRGESALLAPLGLNSSTFLGNHSLDANVVDRLVNALIGYTLPRVEVIIAGVDRAGPHIWVIEDGFAHCEDGVGFACIGSGKRHADSQMMIGQHQPYAELTQALVLAHLAKKRAEISPSVGSGTDMVISGPELGQQVTLASNHIQQLDRHFQQLVAGEKRRFSAVKRLLKPISLACSAAQRSLRQRVCLRLLVLP